jgi:sucrose-phosphate synthase
MRALISDIDGTLLGDEQAAGLYNDYVMSHARDLLLIYATGRSAGAWGHFVDTAGIALPHAVILNVGADVYYSEDDEYLLDKEWHRQIDDPAFTSRDVMMALEPVKGIRLQEFIYEYKISYYTEYGTDPVELEKACRAKLLERGINATIIPSHGEFLDILPQKCDKAKAAKYLLKRYDITEDNAVVAGDSDNDLSLFQSFEKGIVVANALPELKEKVAGLGKYEAVRPYAAGVVEGLKHYFKF